MPYSYRAPLQSDGDPDETRRQHSQSIESLESAVVDRPQVASILDHSKDSVHTVAVTDPVATVVNTLTARNVAAVVVVEGDGTPVGIISERDIVRGLRAHGFGLAAMAARDLMTASLVWCTPDDSIGSVATRMIEGGFRHMPVLHHGRLIGLVAVLDVLKEHVSEMEYENLKIRQAMVG